MSLLSIPLDKIEESFVMELLWNKVPEGISLEYKRESYGRSDSDKREFLADVSSLANTLGGDIIIGLDEADGVPINVVPLTIDADAEIRRLESLALTGIEPRITNLSIRTVTVSGGFIIFVRAPRSLSAPHRVIAQNSNRFFARAGAQKYEPDVGQLRQLFNEGSRFVDRIRSFQIDRLAKIAAGETPNFLGGSGELVLHVIPLPAFNDGRMVDIISRLKQGGHLPAAPDMFHLSSRSAVNLEGYLHHTLGYPGTMSYVQFFRNGAIEGVAELIRDVSGNGYFITRDFTNLVVSRVKQYLDVLKAYELGLPVYVFLSLCNAKSVTHRYVLPYGDWGFTKPLGREVVAAQEICIDDFDVDVIQALRPVFNTIWNAFGFDHCERYDDMPKWEASNPYALVW